MDCNFYVYALINPKDNNIFYIGKGCKNRMNDHFLDCYKVNQNKIKKIKEIKAKGYKPYSIKIADKLPEVMAFKIEAYLINTISNLTNLKTPKNNGKIHLNYRLEKPNRYEKAKII